MLNKGLKQLVSRATWHLHDRFDVVTAPTFKTSPLLGPSVTGNLRIDTNFSHDREPPEAQHLSQYGEFSLWLLAPTLEKRAANLRVIQLECELDLAQATNSVRVFDLKIFEQAHLQLKNLERLEFLFNLYCTKDRAGSRDDAYRDKVLNALGEEIIRIGAFVTDTEGRLDVKELWPTDFLPPECYRWPSVGRWNLTFAKTSD